jgi:hypothetical protein
MRTPQEIDDRITELMFFQIVILILLIILAWFTL